jgi:hypothetical protein
VSRETVRLPGLVHDFLSNELSGIVEDDAAFLADDSGVGRTTSQNAMRRARELGLVVAQGDAGVLEGHPAAGERGSALPPAGRRLRPYYGVL